MGKAQNILKRGHTYYARVSIPADVRDQFDGRLEVVRTLKTRDLAVAKRQVHEALHLIHQEFEAARKKLARFDDDLSAIAREFYSRELALDEAGRWATDCLEGDETNLLIRVPLADLLSKEAGRLTDRGIATVAWAADEIIERHKITINRSHERYRKLCHSLLRAWREALLRVEERDQGRFDGVARDPILSADRASPGQRERNSAKADRLEPLLERYLKEIKGSENSDQKRKPRLHLRFYFEFLDGMSVLEAVNRRSISEWKDALRAFPIKAAETKAFQGLNFTQILAANVELRKPVLSEKTINNYLSSLSAFCTWLRRNGYLNENPAEDVFIQKAEVANPRISYSGRMLNELFRSPLFTGCAKDGKEHEVGNIAVRDWRYWIPLIGPFLGARLNEIAQLYVTDIKEREGVPCFDIQQGSEQRLKNKYSQRTVPVHSTLIEIGLLDYWKRQKEKGHQRLFPELSTDASGRHSAEVSRWYSRYVARIGLKTDRSITFHGFRHTFTDALRRAGYMEAEIAILMGHAPQLMTSDYGNIQSLPISKRHAMIEAMDLDGLDLSHLRIAKAESGHCAIG